VGLAHEEGINFDTADRCGSEPGETETIIGNWFVSRGGWRERTVIATKVYGEMGIWPNEGKFGGDLAGDRGAGAGGQDPLRR
jgi:aryl-alcohol dehydrogenase-like predicted oxidoreductase